MAHINYVLTSFLYFLVCVCGREILSNVTDVESFHIHTLPNTNGNVLTSLYAVEPEIAQECDCGSYGVCSSVNGEQQCNCNIGFSPKWTGSKLLCVPCTCGGWSIDCSFKGAQKVCTCKEGAAVMKLGSGAFCYPCKCGSGSKNCSYDETGLKRCECFPGYKYSYFECEDINECASTSLNDCPSFTDCINTIGSYRCVCKPGFKTILTTLSYTKIDRCEDIDECESWTACDRSLETCINTFGSYYCKCLVGFEYDSVIKICKPSDSHRPWRTAYIVLSVVLAVIILSMLLYARQRYLSR